MKYGLRCSICGCYNAKVRDCELSIALITHRAHVDCDGHGAYRALSVEELHLLERVNATRADSFGAGDGCREGAV
jgi:hypothetical protein